MALPSLKNSGLGLEAGKGMTDRDGGLDFDSENLVHFGHVDR
jgi:hypothetical protein